MLSIGNKKYRNLQEQVAYNTECIQELDKAIDGITLEDKLVIIANDSGTFTDEEMTVLNGPLAFISDGSKVWLKQSETASEFVFKAIDIVATEQGGTHYNVGGSKIVVTRATRAYATSDDVIIVTYNKSQMDALLSTKASLSGATFTGAISAPSILETMSGYSYTQGTQSKGTLEVKYCGAVKTGNKLTLVLFCKYIKTAGASGYEQIGRFTIPSEVASKIVPFDASDIVDGRVLVAYRTNNSYVECIGNIHKYNPYILTFELSSVTPLVDEAEYFIRYEVTFLLGDNLAQ